ncbi:hypothetical protein [Zooshikella sp. RANM57]|uniref:hypothetical protein n=1 Tax=Zooshikella sp. RANM57 TaxID=3425863 RepID=UPI003D7005D1
MLNKLFRKEEKMVSFLICETENDSPELDRVMNWFKERGFKSKEKSWNVVGSQELTTYTLTNGDQEADLLFETYAGVTLFTTKAHESYFSELKINS